MLKAEDFPRVVTRNNITVFHLGKQYTVAKESSAYNDLLEAFRQGDWDYIPDLLSKEALLKTKSGGKLRVENGQVYLLDDDDCEFVVSKSLNDSILFHMEQELDLTPLVAFAKNLQLNPSSRSVQQLFNWLENTRLTITEDGHFIAYKGVTSDFKDPHTKKENNSPGAVCEMRRNEVDDDPSRTCSHGYHVATYDFAKGYSQRLVSVKINPKDVVSVPTDYNMAKMRVSRYQVLEEVGSECTKPVYSSKYEDEEYEDEDEDYDEDDDQNSDEYDQYPNDIDPAQY